MGDARTGLRLGPGPRSRPRLAVRARPRVGPRADRGRRHGRRPRHPVGDDRDPGDRRRSPRASARSRPAPAPASRHHRSRRPPRRPPGPRRRRRRHRRPRRRTRCPRPRHRRARRPGPTAACARTRSTASTSSRPRSTAGSRSAGRSRRWRTRSSSPTSTEVVACLTTVFKAPLAARGFTLVEPTVKTYHKRVESPCGDLRPERLAGVLLLDHPHHLLARHRRRRARGVHLRAPGLRRSGRPRVRPPPAGDDRHAVGLLGRARAGVDEGGVRPQPPPRAPGAVLRGRVPARDRTTT